MSSFSPSLNPDSEHHNSARLSLQLARFESAMRMCDPLDHDFSEDSMSRYCKRYDVMLTEFHILRQRCKELTQQNLQLQNDAAALSEENEDLKQTMDSWSTNVDSLVSSLQEVAERHGEEKNDLKKQIKELKHEIHELSRNQRIHSLASVAATSPPPVRKESSRPCVTQSPVETKLRQAFGGGVDASATKLIKKLIHEELLNLEEKITQNEEQHHNKRYSSSSRSSGRTGHSSSSHVDDHVEDRIQSLRNRVYDSFGIDEPSSTRVRKSSQSRRSVTPKGSRPGSARDVWR